MPKGKRSERYWGKTDNHPQALAAKLELRRNVLAEVQPARVFDAFCGVGEMYRGIWHEAMSYAGCDERQWARTDPPRFVGDNRLVMRAIDLSAWNLFDFDSYCSPWEHMAILAARRPWTPGELGGVVLTDGSSLPLRWGGMPYAMAYMAGLSSPRSPPNTCAVTDLMAMALAGWVKRSNVKVLRMWQAEGERGLVYYTGLVFEGQKSEG